MVRKTRAQRNVSNSARKKLKMKLSKVDDDVFDYTLQIQDEGDGS